MLRSRRAAGCRPAELAKLELAATGPAMPTTAAVAARCRALLEPAAFERHMADAVRLHALGDMPFEQARTELLIAGICVDTTNRARLGPARLGLGDVRAIGCRRLGRPGRDQLEATE